jgi:hypothetical protein
MVSTTPTPGNALPLPAGHVVTTTWHYAVALGGAVWYRGPDPSAQWGARWGATQEQFEADAEADGWGKLGDFGTPGSAAEVQVWQQAQRYLAVWFLADQITPVVCPDWPSLLSLLSMSAALRLEVAWGLKP